jgi:acyl-CoA dehydrogenase
MRGSDSKLETPPNSKLQTPNSKLETDMDSYYFTEEHILFRQSLRAFLAREITPHIDAWEEAGRVPREVYEKFGKMGYFGLAFPEKYGGLGLDFFYQVIFAEELARVNSGGFGAAMGAHASLALTHLAAAGSEALKAQYLTPGIAGKAIGCLAISEPGGGSDVAALQTTARRAGDSWVIHGAKTFITNGVSSDFIVAAVKTQPEAGAKGVSMLLIERDRPGVQATPLRKLGWHASDTAEIAFDGVKVPASNLLGQENMGFYYIMQHFALERLIMAVGAVAAADFALEVTLQYMKEREAFGKKLNRFQELRHRIAQMASEIEMNRQFIYALSQQFQDKKAIVKEAAMAKLLATQLSDRVIYDCLQMHGGYGYMEDYPLARMYRDSRLGTIGGGTSEIMKEIIAKMMF